MAKKNRLSLTALDNYGSEAVKAPEAAEPTEKTSNVSPNSIANLRPRKQGIPPKKYMQLDIIQFDDYLHRIAKYKRMTRTKYILSLIKQDYETHKEEYEMMKKLSEFDR